MTCGFATPDFLLGVGNPHIPPAGLGSFPLVTALRVDRGESAALMVCYKRPGQSLFLDKVELGGIEPLEIVWLGVDRCCLVVVSCDDAV